MLYKVAKRLGMVPERDGLPVDAGYLLAEHISAAYEYGLRQHDWPEARRFVQASVQDHPQFGCKVALSTGQTVLHVWEEFPLFVESPQEIAFTVSAAGIVLPSETASSVCVEYRLSTQEFTIEEWEDTVTGMGESRWATDGHCYVALGSVIVNPASHALWEVGTSYEAEDLRIWCDVVYWCNTAHTATVDQEPGFGSSWREYWTPVWERQTILQRLEAATISGAVALYLAGEGMTSTAQVLSGAMLAELENQVCEIHRQTGGSGLTKQVLRSNPYLQSS